MSTQSFIRGDEVVDFGLLEPSGFILVLSQNTLDVHAHTFLAMNIICVHANFV